jgi:rare lipoprotein A (peptidoglycan hydrolase)
MTQSNVAERLIAAIAILSMLILIPATAGAATSNNSNYRSDAHVASEPPNLIGNPLTPLALTGRAARHTARERCRSRQCKRREWLKHHPRPTYRYEGEVEASWYGPGFYGQPLGCSAMGTYQEDQMGVANKVMPCGTRLEICYPTTGRCAQVTVVDRGPYVAGREFDLQRAPKEALGFDGTGMVKWRYLH